MMYTKTNFEDLIRSGKKFRELFALMLPPEKNFVKLIFVFTTVTALLNLVIPVIIQTIINNLGVRHLLQPIIITSFLLLFVLSFAGIFQSIIFYIAEVLKRRLFIRYGAIIIERLSRYREEVYEKVNSPDLLNRYFDVMVAQTSLVVLCSDGAAFIIQCLIGLVLLIFYHPFFIFFSLFIIVCFCLSWILFGPKGVEAGSPEADGKYDTVAWIEDIGRTRSLFMSSVSREFAMDKFTCFIQKWLVKRDVLFTQVFRQSIALQICNTLTYTMLVTIGGIMVMKQQISIGQLVAAVLVVTIILSNLSRLQNFFIAIYDFSTALDKIAQFYDHPIEESVLAPKIPTRYDIKLQNITISPNFGLDVEFPYGSKNYILIKSFSAKNILQQILYGLKPPKSGEYLLGEYIVKDIGFSNIRNEIVIIKDNGFFNATIHENLIALARRKVTFTEIDQILEAVGLKENIELLPDKLNTVIGPSGYPLTKSQLLALQFARTLIIKPKILLVNSVFEIMSSQKRMKIFKLITDKSQPWTLLFFSQRVYPEKYFEQFYHIVRKNVLKYDNYKQFIGDINTYEQY